MLEMVIEYKKGAGIRLSEHFTSSDFDCHCSREDCKVTLVSALLVQGLEIYWTVTGGFKINSGFRCAAHNAEVGGESGSYHPKGYAADCQSTTGLSGKEMAKRAQAITVFDKGGIGTYPGFAHVDTRGKKARWGAVNAC